MGFSALQIILVFVWVFIVAIDQFDFLESLYQPIVSGAVIGAILGDLPTGLIVGGTYQLMTIGNMPVGGAQPPNAVIGGVMATVFAISSHLDTTAAVGLAVPFALIGQYMVTFLFTLMSPMMSKADQLAAKGDTKGIVRLNYLAMALLGLLFAIVCTLGMLGGSAMGYYPEQPGCQVCMDHGWSGRCWRYDALRRFRYPAAHHAFQRVLGHLLCRFRSGNHHRLHPRAVRFCSAADRIRWYCDRSV